MIALRKAGVSTVGLMRLRFDVRQRATARRLILPASILAAAAAAFALAGASSAAVKRFKDDEGRTITLDVKSSGVDAAWYADLLRGATHGDEIGSVTIRIVRPDRLVRHCGPGASGCYARQRGGGRIVVPAGRDADVAHTLLHEYGHHVDQSQRHRGLPEPNGTRAWWAARKMAVRLKRGKVAFGYQRGWERSIGEIFAEDYAQTQLRTRYGISWLRPPDDALRAALTRDLGALPATPAQPDVEPLVLRRSGTIETGQRRALPFGLLGPDRRVTFTVRLGGSAQQGTRARLVLVCGGVRLVKPFKQGTAIARIDRRGLGPARCDASVVNTAGKSLAYDMTLRLAIQK